MTNLGILSSAPYCIVFFHSPLWTIKLVMLIIGTLEKNCNKRKFSIFNTQTMWRFFPLLTIGTNIETRGSSLFAAQIIQWKLTSKKNFVWIRIFESLWLSLWLFAGGEKTELFDFCYLDRKHFLTTLRYWKPFYMMCHFKTRVFVQKHVKNSKFCKITFWTSRADFGK